MAATYITVTNATTTQLSLVGDEGKPRIDIPATGGSNSVTINITDLLGNSLLCTTLASWTTSSKITSTRGSVTLTAADFTAWAQGSDMNRSDYDTDDDTVIDTAEAIKVNNPTAVAAAASPYTVLSTDTVLLVDTTAGAVEVDLPAVASSSGRTIVVKDEGGVAATNQIVIDPNGAETLDGSATSATINTNFGFMSLFCDGTQWLSNAKSKAHDAEVLDMTGTAVNNAASPYTVLVTDTLILVDTAGGGVELDLPAVASNAGRTIMIVDEGGVAGTTAAITIDPNGAETIDGSATSATINEDFGHMCLYCDGTQWLSWSGSRALSVWDATTEVSGAAVVQSVANWAGSITAVNFAASPYAGLATDEVIATDATGGAIAITLPPPVARKTIKVIDTTGTISSTNTVTVSQNAAELIDGATSIVMDTPYESLTLVSDGTNWFTFGAISRLNEGAAVHVATRTVGFADLTLAAGNQSFDFATTLPADAWILGSYIDVTEGFTDGAAGVFTADLGESGGVTDALIDGADISAIAKVPTTVGALPTGFTYAGDTMAVDIIATVNVNTATAGALTAKIAYIRMDNLIPWA